MDMLYVTYGFGTAKNFDVTKIETDLSEFIGKPRCAWWGSPVTSKYGWKEWCEDNYFIPEDKANDIDEYFDEQNALYWKLKTGSKILMINSYKDLEDFVERNFIELKFDKDTRFSEYKWNFRNVLTAGYSAIQLNDACLGHRFISKLELTMNSWDCESIVVLDPEKIIIQK